MNSDRNPEDTRFVMQTVGLNYPTLKNGSNAEGINTRYGVRSWPTLVVLDRQGVVRHFHFGYSPTLREVLAAKIREILADE